MYYTDEIMQSYEALIDAIGGLHHRYVTLDARLRDPEGLTFDLRCLAALGRLLEREAQDCISKTGRYASTTPPTGDVA